MSKLSGFTILVVDDTETNVDILVDALADFYEISVAMDGESALESIAENQPDLILLDIMMPGMSGYDVCETLKSKDNTKDIPIIFITALEKPDQEASGLKMGAADYITKPFNPSLVKLRIDNQMKLIQASRELKEQNQILKENQRLKDEVDTIARHDLKTPLSSLINIPELLMKETNITPEQKEMLEMISQSGLRVMDIINSSIDLYKMEKGEYKLRCAPIDLVRIMRQLKGEISQLIASKDITLGIDIQRNPVKENDIFIVFGEETLFYSMFVNLVKNAVEASPDGEHVSIEMEVQNDTPVILIHNSGIIPEEIRETFFDKNVTHGKPEGSGIGTYSAQLIAKTLEGRITFHSDEELGTTLSVKLPDNLKKKLSKTAMPFYTENFFQKTPEEIESFIQANHNISIMVLDDYPIMRGTIVSILRQMGFNNFIRLSNGQEGLKRIEKEKVNLIISDYNMPKMNGLQLLERVKDTDHLKDIPFIMITAEAESEFVKKAASLGVSGFVIKPFSADLLIEKVSRVLSASK
jgi:two-component system sensor histidine kinase/response regulator